MDIVGLYPVLVMILACWFIPEILGIVDWVRSGKLSEGLSNICYRLWTWLGGEADVFMQCEKCGKMIEVTDRSEDETQTLCRLHTNLYHPEDMENESD